MIEKRVESSGTNELQVWKVIGIFAMVFVTVQLSVAIFGVGINFLMRQFDAGQNVRVFIGSTISRAGMIAAVLLFCAPVITKVFDVNIGVILYPLKKRWLRDLIAGLGISALSMTLIFLIESGFGWLKIENLALSGSPLDAIFRAIWMALLVNLVAAVGEEVLFRGLLVTGLKKAWDAPGALFISAVIFGASHILVTGAAQTSLLIFIPLLALPGVMLGWAYLRSGNLWLATGIHFAWNFFQDSVFNLASRPTSDTLIGFETSQIGPAWFMGTSYGIEVGLAGIIVLALVFLGIWLYTRGK
jgi:hypothetical protein